MVSTSSPNDDYRRDRPLSLRKQAKPQTLARELPHSLEGEVYLLSACLLDGSDTITQCLRAGLTGAVFYGAAHRLIFERLVELHADRGEVDVAILGEELRSRGELEQVGGYSFLSEVSAKLPTTAQAKYFIEQLLKLARQRARAKGATALLEAVFADDDEAISKAEESIKSASKRQASDLPPILKFTDFVGDEMSTLPDEIVQGVLHRGGKMMVTGGSKSFKTWLLMDLALSVAAGAPFWGMRTHKGRVLYLNMELMREFAEGRVRSIMCAKKLEREDVDGLDTWHLRGYARDFKELLPVILRAIAGVHYDLIILDPVYKVLGDRDENANGDVASLLNEFESLAVHTGAGFAYGHHHSKGNQGEKDAKDRGSGAGAWTRDPDALLDLAPHAEEEHFTVTFTLRNHAPKNAMVVHWEFPCMIPADGLDPHELRKPGRPNQHTVKALMAVLGDNVMGFAEWERASERKGISSSTFKRLKKQAEADGSVVKSGTFYKRNGA